MARVAPTQAGASHNSYGPTVVVPQATASMLLVALWCSMPAYAAVAADVPQWVPEEVSERWVASVHTSRALRQRLDFDVRDVDGQKRLNAIQDATGLAIDMAHLGQPTAPFGAPKKSYKGVTARDAIADSLRWYGYGVFGGTVWPEGNAHRTLAVGDVEEFQRVLQTRLDEGDVFGAYLFMLHAPYVDRPNDPRTGEKSIFMTATQKIAQHSLGDRMIESLWRDGSTAARAYALLAWAADDVRIFRQRIAATCDDGSPAERLWFHSGVVTRECLCSRLVLDALERYAERW